MSASDRDNFFEIAYEHFAEAGVWAAYPESEEVLAAVPAALRAGGCLELRRATAHDFAAARTS